MEEGNVFGVGWKNSGGGSVIEGKIRRLGCHLLISRLLLSPLESGVSCPHRLSPVVGFRKKSPQYGCRTRKEVGCGDAGTGDASEMLHPGRAGRA